MPARCLINQTLEVKHLLNNERLFACGVVPCKLLCNLEGLLKTNSCLWFGHSMRIAGLADPLAEERYF